MNPTLIDRLIIKSESSVKKDKIKNKNKNSKKRRRTNKYWQEQIRLQNRKQTKVRYDTYRREEQPEEEQPEEEQRDFESLPNSKITLNCDFQFMYDSEKEEEEYYTPEDLEDDMVWWQHYCKQEIRKKQKLNQMVAYMTQQVRLAEEIYKNLL